MVGSMVLNTNEARFENTSSLDEQIQQLKAEQLKEIAGITVEAIQKSSVSEINRLIGILASNSLSASQLLQAMRDQLNDNSVA